MAVRDKPAHRRDRRQARHSALALDLGCGRRGRPTLRGGPDAEPGVYFDRLARKATIAAVELSDTFIDIGTPEALAALRSKGRA